MVFSETGKKVNETIFDFLKYLKQEQIENPETWGEWDLEDIADDLTLKVSLVLQKEELVLYKEKEGD